MSEDQPVRMSGDLQLLRQFINFFAFGNYFLTYFYKESCYVNTFPEQQLTATHSNCGATLASQLIPLLPCQLLPNNAILPQGCNTTPIFSPDRRLF